ncbi:alkaline shock response membrane anchor protein AmaP [Kitasatospora sp. NPDC088346]|uniref:alkaline shock response membrane anchor protein AmaP n=1 Tax=Kitasatospora sp. NPDC088346 TaxID=3364073 RepID=UPI003806C1AC
MSRTAVNRTVLAVVGVLLLGGGLLVLAGGLDLYARVHLSMPRRWPLLAPDHPLLGEAARTRWVHRAWWWPVAIAVPALIVAGALGWLFTQLRRTGPGSLELAPPAAATTVRVRADAVEDVLETGTVALPGVERVTVHLAGRRGRPVVVRAAVRLEPGGSPAALLAGYSAGPLAQLRSSLGLHDLRSELRLRVSGRRRPARTRGRSRRSPRVV